MKDVEAIRRQVAIGGKVNDGVTTLAGVLLVAASDGAAGLRSHVISREDGCFVFLDLADAEYTVTATADAGTAQGTAHVQRKADGSLPMVWLDLELSLH